MEAKTLSLSGGCGSENARQHTLSICVPTYNRAVRLSRSLDEILEIVARCELRDFVSVYVTDNGSTDNTKDILIEQSKHFAKHGISFSHESVETNMGFDSNIQQCFIRGMGDYCWFVSDDDNLEDDILKNIFRDIREFEPNLIFYNFDQAPFSKSTPLTSEQKFSIDSGTDFGFTKLIQFPKLTSLVIKRIADSRQSEVFDYDYVLSSGFTHIALAMHTAYHFGRILLSNSFCARPDSDFRDHIDFPPYIGNNFNKMATVLFQHMGKPEWINLHSAAHTDVGVSALEWLIDYYKGRAVVPYELRLELLKGVRGYIAEKKIKLLLHPKFIRRSIYLAVAWLKFLILEKVFRLRIAKQRAKPDNSNLHRRHDNNNQHRVS